MFFFASSTLISGYMDSSYPQKGGPENVAKDNPSQFSSGSSGNCPLFKSSLWQRVQDSCRASHQSRSSQVDLSAVTYRSEHFIGKAINSFSPNMKGNNQRCGESLAQQHVGDHLVRTRSKRFGKKQTHNQAMTPDCIGRIDVGHG